MKGYKDTGTEWLGKIPENWNIYSLKRLLSEFLKYGANEPAELEDESLPRYIRITDFGSDGKLKDNTFKSLTFEQADGYYLEEGDVLFARSGATVGKTFIFKNYKGVASFAGYLIKAKSNRYKLLPEYLYLYTNSYVYETWKNLIFTQATIQNIGADKYSYLPVILPPLPEQKLIAAYLDKTTGTIDNAIAVKKQQLVKLEELKKSVIYNAVTKGLDDSVKYKDSGVEWVGKIPKHWAITKLKNHCEVIPSSVDKKTEENELEVELCNYTDVYYNRYIKSNLDYMKATASEAEIKKFQLRVNDVIITKDSEDPNDIAVPAIVKDTKDNLLCGYHLSIIRCDKILVGSYLFWCIYDSSIVSQFHREATGITRWAIANKHVKNGIIPLPPISEQNEIHNYIHKKMDELDITVNKIESQIQKLEDYKKSLIHECVTGKRRITEKDIREVI